MNEIMKKSSIKTYYYVIHNDWEYDNNWLRQWDIIDIVKTQLYNSRKEDNQNGI